MHTRVRTLVRWARSNPALACIVALSVLAALKGLHDLFGMISVSFMETIWQDEKIYAAAGRALLNGINPYAEFFENKPPLVFLVMGASLWLTGTQLLAAFVHGLSLASFPAALGMIGYRASAGSEAWLRRMWMSAGVLFGLALSGYVYQRSGAAIQTEAVGAAAGAWYVAIAVRRWKEPILQVAFAALTVFIAIWMKEPFVLIFGAAALLLFRTDYKQILSMGAVPGIVALWIGILLLLALGVFHAYVTVYLPFMATTHVEYRGSPWMRGLHVEKLVANLFEYSPFLLFAIAALVILFVITCMLRDETWKQRAPVLAVAAVALYAASFVVGLGGQYYPHHFVFAVPVYAALFAAVASCSTDDRRPMLAPSLVLVLLSAALLFHPPTSIRLSGPWLGGPTEAEFRNRAVMFDMMMDACGYDRYLPYGWELEDLWAYTRHTPYSSTFTSYRFGLSHTQEFFSQIFTDQLNETPLIVLLPGRVAELENDTGGKQIWQIFTKEVPPCASTYTFRNPDGEQLLLLFRKG